MPEFLTNRQEAIMARASLSPQSQPFSRIQVGTSGYSYAEWVTAGFYPPQTQPGHMLPLYAREFGVTELNFTWYQMPKAASLERMRQQVPPEFRFTAKLTRSLTHEVDPDQWRSQAAQYRLGLAPLIQSRQLAAVLVQLPPGFDRSAAHRQYLSALLDELAGLPLAVEFRHRSWAVERVFTELARRQVTLVTVDAPDLPNLFPPLAVVTHAELVYGRFHGRNTRGWRSGHLQQQFDYLYRPEELAEWVNRYILPMSRESRQGLYFFNNHVRSQATVNARQLIQLLLEAGLGVETPCACAASSI